jgi:Leucine-rich repeat (LRR) protein
LAEHFEGYVAPPPFADGQLRRLILRSTQLRDAGAQVVLGAAHLGGLEELDISQCRIDDAATLEALRDAPALRGVKRLALAGNQGLGPALGALAGWPGLEHIAALTLPQTTTADALRALFPSASSSLHTLDVGSAKELLAAPEGILRIAESLARLDIGTTRIGDAGFRKLLDSPQARPLVELAANGCSLSDASVEALTTSKLDRLVSLDLSSNKLTDRALSALAAWPGIANIATLRLGNNRKLSAAGYAALIDAPSFSPASLDVGKVDAKTLDRLRERFDQKRIKASE